MLKVGWRHDESEHEADALRVWNGHGAVRLHGAYVSGHTSALLVERCVPGALLAHVVPESEQDHVVAGLLRRLWIQPPDGHPFRTLQVMCDQWAAEFEDEFARAPGVSIQAWHAKELLCSALYPLRLTTAYCCAPICTARTSWPRSVNHGLSSTPSPVWATRPTIRCNTCSTALTDWQPTPPAWPSGWPI